MPSLTVAEPAERELRLHQLSTKLRQICSMWSEMEQHQAVSLQPQLRLAGASLSTPGSSPACGLLATSFIASSFTVRLNAPRYSSSCFMLVCPVVQLPRCHLDATLHACDPSRKYSCRLCAGHFEQIQKEGKHMRTEKESRMLKLL